MLTITSLRALLLQPPPLADLLAGQPGAPADNHGAERGGLRDGPQGLSRTGLIEISRRRQHRRDGRRPPRPELIHNSYNSL
ncbi:MAG: hypothetical protein ACRDOH_21195 [Streptosporangiaceae bacterium]